MTDLIWYYVLIRFLDSTHSLFLLLLFYLFILFYLAVILFCFICSPLSNVPLQRNQCYHHVIHSHVFSGFQCSLARVAICPDKSLLSVGWNVGVVFTFTTVERTLLLLFVLLAGSATEFYTFYFYSWLIYKDQLLSMVFERVSFLI